MSIISASDFVHEYNIPNRTKPEIAEDINWFISKYEPQLLVELLGADLYSLLKAGLPSGTVTTVASQNTVVGVGSLFTTMFIVGDSITVNGETLVIDTITDDTHLTTETNWSASNAGVTYIGKQKWIDLKDQVKVSIICYVYYYFRRDNATLFTGIGEAISKAENAIMVSPIVKMVDRWNEMVKNNYATVKFIDDHQADYGAYYTPEWCMYYTIWDWRGRCVPGIFRVQNTLNI